MEGVPVKDMVPTAVAMSPTISDLAAALAKAQAEIEGARKDSTNPHFRSRYADLASVWDACRAPLTKHGLSVVQLPDRRDAEIGVTTLLMHSSGQWISGRISTVPGKLDPQAVGSATTYLRRYALSAVAGVAPEDDDGEGAMGRQPEKIVRITDEQADRLTDLVNETGTNWPDFLGFFHVQVLGELPAKDYQRALQLLQTKVRIAVRDGLANLFEAVAEHAKLTKGRAHAAGK